MSHAITHSGLLARLTSLYQSLRARWRFKVVLPNTTLVFINGIRLDVQDLPSMMKNHIMEGRYEFQERRMVDAQLSVTDRVLELGGAIGYISLHCRCNLGIHYYTSVEPNPNTLAMMERNHKLNHIEARYIHAAAADRDGSMQLDISGDFWCNSLIRSSTGGSTITVPTLSLASILKRLDYTPTVLIADIEGAEQYIDFSALPAATRKIIIELHPDVIGQDKVDHIKSRLALLGFNLIYTDAGTSLFTRA
jgi:FkbM family methyltransferase